MYEIYSNVEGKVEYILNDTVVILDNKGFSHRYSGFKSIYIEDGVVEIGDLLGYSNSLHYEVY